MMSALEAAREFGYTKSRVSQLAREGRIKARKVPSGHPNGYWLVDPDSLRQYTEGDRLTPRRLEALRTLVRWWDEHGYAPTMEELARAMGMRYNATASVLVSWLRAHGYVERGPRRWRSARVTAKGRLALRG